MVAPRRKNPQQEVPIPNTQQKDEVDAARGRQAGISWMLEMDGTPGMEMSEIMEMVDDMVEDSIISPDDSAVASLRDAMKAGDVGTDHVVPVLTMVLNFAAKEEGYEPVPDEVLKFLSAQASGKCGADEWLAFIDILNEAHKSDNCHPIFTEMFPAEGDSDDEEDPITHTDLMKLLKSGGVSMGENDWTELVTLLKAMDDGKVTHDDFMPIMQVALNGIASSQGVPPPPQPFVFWCASSAAGIDFQGHTFLPVVNWILDSFETGNIHPWLQAIHDAGRSDDGTFCPYGQFLE